MFIRPVLQAITPTSNLNNQPAVRTLVGKGCAATGETKPPKTGRMGVGFMQLEDGPTHSRKLLLCCNVLLNADTTRPLHHPSGGSTRSSRSRLALPLLSLACSRTV
jgi:hypothetical protein